MIKKYLSEYAVFWEISKQDFPIIHSKFSLNDKLIREKTLDRYIESAKIINQRKFDRKKFTENNEHQFYANTRTFLLNGLDFTEKQLQLIFSDELTAVTRLFVSQARQFDPALTFHDIFQACRNMWIMNGLQIVLGLRVRLTPSVLAYSLLYPYTDNLIDDPAIPAVDKLIFSNNFYQRLAGQYPKPNNETEQKIFSLVAMIEEEFPRSAYPKVYESLIAIHKAQTQSMHLIHSVDSLSETEMLQIELAKGGASVLADGYLVAGHLDKNQELFLFGYGAYLQLLDDIQDVDEDLAAGLNTIFSKSVGMLDDKVNKTYWFGEQVMQSLKFFGGQHAELFQSLMRKSMDLFIIEAIAQNRDFYSKKYVTRMEDHSPFSFSYIQKQKKQFSPYNGLLLTAIEGIAFREYIASVRDAPTSVEWNISE